MLPRPRHSARRLQRSQEGGGAQVVRREEVDALSRPHLEHLEVGRAVADLERACDEQAGGSSALSV